MANELEDDGNETSLMSLLDTLSNGLGAAVMLGLIFSLTRADDSVALSAPEAILVEVRWEDANALMNLLVQPPWNCKGYEFDLTNEEIKSGRVFTQPCGEHDIRIVSYGLSQRGDDRLVDAENKPSVLLLVLGPEDAVWKSDATWRLGVRYFNRREAVDRWKRPLSEFVFVQTTVTVGDASRVKRPPAEKDGKLTLGGVLPLEQILVVPR